MKKTIAFLFLSTFLVAVIWFFFFQDQFRTPFSKIHPLEAVPNNASMVFEFEDYFLFRHALAKMPYSDGMSDAFFVKKMSDDFKNIRKIFNKNKDHRKLLIENSITASIHLSGKLDVDFLYIIQDDNKIFSLDKMEEAFDFKKSISRGNTIYRVKAEGGNTFFIAYYKGILFFSKHAYLVENGMHQIKSPTTNLLNSHNISLEKIKEGKEAQIKITILPENLRTLAHPFFRKETPDFLSFFSNNISQVQLNLKFKREGVSIDGNIEAKDEKTLLQDLFQNNILTKTESVKILPENVAYYFRHSLSDLTPKKESSEIFNKYFQPWLGEEWLVGRMEVFTRKMVAEKFVVFKSKDIYKSKRYLEKLSKEEGLLESYEYQTFPIRKLILETIPIPFAKDEIELRNPFFTCIGEYVIFAGSGKVLENWIDKYFTGQTLNSNSSFLKMKNSGGKNGFMEFYWNTQAAFRLLNRIFIQIGNQTAEQLKLWEKFPTLGLNSKYENGKLILNGFLFFQKEAEKKADVKWRTTLQANALTPPSAIYNDEKNVYEIFVQDENFILYKFNSEGQEEWNKPLDSPILSKIWAADFSRNDSRLLIFNTKNKIHLMDFEGESQTGFPMELSSSITNGLLLAEFDETDFGIFVACENGLVYGFDQNGIPLSGWNSIEINGEILEPFQHFQTSENDFILAQNTGGDIFSFGKNGFSTMSITDDFNKSSFPICFQVIENKLIIVNQNGETEDYDLLGGELKRSKDKITQVDGFQFSTADFGGNNNLDLAILQNNDLKIFFRHQNKFQEFGNFIFTNTPNSIFSVQSKNMGKSKLGVVSSNHHQIYLFNKKGKLHPDFPLAGSSKFELVNLFSDNKNAVIVADGDQVIVYELP